MTKESGISCHISLTFSCVSLLPIILMQSAHSEADNPNPYLTERNVPYQCEGPQPAILKNEHVDDKTREGVMDLQTPKPMI